MRISTFCHFGHQKRQYDVILMDSTRLCAMKSCVMRNVTITNINCKMHHSRIVIQNNIILSFLMTKVTKCGNSHVDTLNNNKYKYLARFQHVSSVIERLANVKLGPVQRLHLPASC